MLRNSFVLNLHTQENQIATVYKLAKEKKINFKFEENSVPIYTLPMKVS